MKFFVYPKGHAPHQEYTPEYVNYLPLSRHALQCEVELTDNPKRADFFFMGQFGDGVKGLDGMPVQDYLDKSLEHYFKRFPYLESCPHKHILNKNGDWADLDARGRVVEKDIRDYFMQCVVFTNNISLSRHPERTYVYPCQSLPFLSLIDREYVVKPAARSFYFQGCPDLFGIRRRVKSILGMSGLPHDAVILPGGWSYADPASDFVKIYFSRFESNMFAVCPRGGGRDSIRFFEACFFGRIPIVIGDPLLPGEDIGHRYDFFFRVPQSATNGDLLYLFNKVYNLSDDEINQKSQQARAYFENVIRPRVKNPTQSFLSLLRGDT